MNEGLETLELENMPLLSELPSLPSTLQKLNCQKDVEKAKRHFFVYSYVGTVIDSVVKKDETQDTDTSDKDDVIYVIEDTRPVPEHVPPPIFTAG